MKRALIVAGACLLSGACAYPTASVEQGGSPSHFKIADAPAGAVISVDGRVVGQRTSNAYDLFPVQAGAHTVEERLGDRLLLKKPFSVDLGATVEVRND